MDLIQILVFLIIICAILWGARAIPAAFGIGDPIATIIMVIAVVFVLIACLNQIGGVGGGPILNFHHG